MNKRFQDQIVLVTGGTRGIGRAITLAFLSEGATVVATYLSNSERALQFKNEFPQYEHQLKTVQCDSSKQDQIEKLFVMIESDHQRLDVLVNNSGIRKDCLVATMNFEQWNDVINTNLTGTFFMCQKAVLLFLKNRYGRIVNISSIGGKLGLPGQANYAATKAGQLALTKSLSKEVAKKGITVNCVAPGFIETELIQDLPEEQVKEYRSQVPMKRFGRADEVAHAVLFLAEKDSAYITGTSLEITGGLA